MAQRPSNNSFVYREMLGVLLFGYDMILLLTVVQDTKRDILRWYQPLELFAEDENHLLKIGGGCKSHPDLCRQHKSRIDGLR